MEAIFIFAIVFVVIPAVAVAAWRFFLLFFFPDMYRQAKEHDHQRALAKEATRKQGMGLLGGIINLFK